MAFVHDPKLSGADQVQLIRLMSEAHAVLTHEQVCEMAQSMDLTHDEVRTLLNLNEERWEAIKDLIANPITWDPDASDRLGLPEATIIMMAGTVLGRSTSEKDCYWKVYESNGRFFIGLMDTDNIWEVTERTAKHCIDIPARGQ
jgi:hypothetical protein